MSDAVETAIEPLSMRVLGSDPHRFAAMLFASFQTAGFAVVEDHGLDASLIAGVQEVSRRFFDLPEQAKMAYCDPSGGWSAGLYALRAGKRQGRDRA